MASIDSAKKRVAEIAAQTVTMFMQDSIPLIIHAINVRLSVEFGGEQVHFGKDKKDRDEVRNALIRTDRAAGLSIRAIGKKYHLSNGRVMEICGNAAPSEPRQ
jgi:Mor family transcriptional regulator